MFQLRKRYESINQNGDVWKIRKVRKISKIA